MSVESAELKIYIDNDYQLYSGQRKSIVDNLLRKKNAGKYDSTKSVKLWGYLAEAGAKKYEREFGGTRIFSVADRKQVARELRDDFEDAHRLGEHMARQEALETLAQRKARTGSTAGRPGPKRKSAVRRKVTKRRRIKKISTSGDLPFGWGKGAPFPNDGKGTTKHPYGVSTIIVKYGANGTYNAELLFPETDKWLPGASGRTRAEAVKQTKKLAPKMAKKRRAKRASTCGTPRGKCTKAEIEKMFKSTVMPTILDAEAYDGIPDRPMRREAWNNWVDGLQRDGTITERQADTWGHPKWLETYRGRRR